jgi:chemotaxis protein MotB
MSDDVRPIIVKKIIQGGGHHGGAWKVAYADFVTAMMAFFLLLWLLNVTTDEQKMGIADYFAPTSVSRSQSGSGGILGGKTMSDEGAKIGDAASPTIIIELTPPRIREQGEVEEAAKEENLQASRDGLDGQENGTKGEERQKQTEAEKKEPTEAELLEKMAAREQRDFERAEAKLRAAMEDLPELEGLQKHLIIDNTQEGLRIQIIDQDGRSMFPSGSAAMHEHTEKILQQVARVILETSNNISITGHTDSVPFRSGGDSYGNWELSSDRANASRRSLMTYGIASSRISRVSGLAETEPLIQEDPANPTNRRIAIVLLRQAPVLPPGSSAGQN